MRLLVVESGYEVDACEDGEEALDILASEQYDLILLDLNLPKVDGMTVLRTLRQSDLETRVLILSARSEIADKVDGLDAGANDYLSKPFHLAELEARVRSLTRRQFIQRDICLRCGRLSFDTKSRVASVDGQPLSLTRKECGVLEYLLLHQGRLPAGKGGGGMGERKQTKGRAGRRPKPPSPLRLPERQGRQAANKASPRRYKMFTKVRASPP